MGIANRAGTGVVAALIGIAGAAIPAGHAAAATGTGDVQAAKGCPVTRWGHEGQRMCGAGHLWDVDWDVNGSTDETFVIAPNREIWHTWANAGGWKEMPGDGRADTFHLWAKVGSWRCIAVWAGSTSWDNVFDDGKWHGWTRGAC